MADKAIMTGDELRRLSEGQEFMGPTLLAHRPFVKKMKRLPLCAICPAAQWYESGDKDEDKEDATTFVAFCTRFHRTMYDHVNRIIVNCDAYEDAIAEVRL